MEINGVCNRIFLSNFDVKIEDWSLFMRKKRTSLVSFLLDVYTRLGVGKEERNSSKSGRKALSYVARGSRKVKRRQLRITQQEKREAKLDVRKEVEEGRKVENIDLKILSVPSKFKRGE